MKNIRNKKFFFRLITALLYCSAFFLLKPLFSLYTFHKRVVFPHQHPLTAVTLSPCGNYVAYEDIHKTLFHYEVGSGKLLNVLYQVIKSSFAQRNNNFSMLYCIHPTWQETPTSSCAELVFSRDYRLDRLPNFFITMPVYNNQEAILFLIVYNNQLLVYEKKNNGEYLQIELIDNLFCQPITSFSGPFTSPITTLFMGQENQLFIGHEDGAISCWELCRDSQRNYYCCTQSFLPLHQGAAIKKLHLTNDSRYLITHAKNKSHFIIIWDIKRNRALFEVEKKENFPLACIPSPCSTKFILSGNSTRKGAFLEQRSIVNGNILHDLLHDHDKKKLRFITASYAERGKKILALTVCGKLFVWDSSTGRFLQQLCLPRPCNDYYCTLFYSETNKTLLLLTRYGVVDYCFNEE